MPIKPENKRLYPHNWKAIRAAILKRADNKCEICGVPNYSIGCFIKVDGKHTFAHFTNRDCISEFGKPIKVVLTIMHLDHNPRNNDFSNLKAGCQRCHNAYDSEHRKANAAITRAKKKQTQTQNEPLTNIENENSSTRI